jgi:hypothetical protein
MKIILSLVMGIGLVLSVGMVYAEEGMSCTKDTSDKMIGNDDLLQQNLDKDRATVNQMTTEPGSEGSAAGGVSKEPESTGTDVEHGKAPVDRGPAAPGEDETGPGGAGKAPERYRY